MSNEEIVLELKSLIIKLRTIKSMMRKGEFIVADEWMGGIMQRLINMGVKIQQCKPSSPEDTNKP